MEAGDGTIHTDNWQLKSHEGGNVSVDLGIVMMDGISALTKKTEDGIGDRFGYDAETKRDGHRFEVGGVTGGSVVQLVRQPHTIGV